MKKLIKQYLVEIYEVDNTQILNKEVVKNDLIQVVNTVIDKQKLKKLFDEREKQISLNSSKRNNTRIDPKYQDEVQNVCWK